MYVSSLASSRPPVSITYSTDCNECLCDGLRSNTTTYVAVNCFTDSHVCQFYTDYATNYSFQWNSASYLYLFQFPSLITGTTATVSETTSTHIPTTTTTMAIATPSCTPQARNDSELLSIRNPSSSSFPNYTCYAYKWVAATSSATLSFLFHTSTRSDWLLDDVSVYHDSTEMIVNGDFESGNLHGWIFQDAYNYNSAQVYRTGVVQESDNWYYRYYSNRNDGTLNQTFPTNAGHTYVVSFWLTISECCPRDILARVNIYDN